MFRLALFVSAIALLGATLAMRDGAQPAAAAPAGAIPGQYIVVLNDDADPGAEAKNAARSQGVAIDHVYTHALNGFAFRGSAAAAAALARNPNVSYVIADQAVSVVGGPGDSRKPGGGGGGTTPSQEVPTGISRIGAYPASSTGFGVGVAVIDTGIDLTHPDLGAPVNGRNCISPGKTANDDNGHGSHVAGTIAARDNGTGVVGVAPGATLYAVKVLNARGSGSWSSVICGIDWVTANANKIGVANMSLGGAGTATPTTDTTTCSNSSNDALHTAICKSVKAGVTYAVAAGNSASDASGFLPAAYEEVITVSALADYDGLTGGLKSPTCANYGGDDTFASFSNFGAPVDIAGPGVCIKSTWKGGGYKTISGTSMATPHVAGAAALYVGANPGAFPAAVKTALLNSAEAGPIPGDPDEYPEGLVKVN